MTPHLVGIAPRFPLFLNRWKWLTTPLPAERMAALRIAVAAVLLLDLGLGCLSEFAALFTANGLAGRHAFPWRFREGHFYWSVLRWLPDAWGPPALMAVWLAAAVALLIGYRPFVAGLVAWACAVSFWNINPWVANGGDQVRNFLLFLVACGRTGAVWGVHSVRQQGVRGPVVVPGWPYRLLWVYLASMYFFSGLYKLKFPAWRDGSAMAAVNVNAAWSMMPAVTAALPALVHRFSTWLTLGWELAFPLLICFRRSRIVALWTGVVFHVASFLTLEIGAFALYSLAGYAAFVRWEGATGRGCRAVRWQPRPEPSACPPAASPASSSSSP